MPAYRSSHEADIRDDVVKHIRERWPSARIIHEINVAGQGSNRIDVLAVAPEAMLAVEIKSKKDKLDRLPDQLKAMRRAVHFSFAAIHEKFLVPHETNEWSAWWTDEDGKHWNKRLPDDLDLLSSQCWVWPRERRAAKGSSYDFLSKWDFPAMPMQAPLPQGALDMLWADELRTLCHELRFGVGPRTTMSQCLSVLRWNATGKELTRGVCRALRRRNCIEADDPVFDKVGDLL